MGERKVLNKYYPPDFDPERLQKYKRFAKRNDEPYSRKSSRKNKQMSVRMMFPFTFRCSTCKEFTYVGTKFNSKVEKVEGEDYLGLIIWRFYGRCPSCRSEILFKTDPKNCDYILEFGGVRTYDARKDSEIAEKTYVKMHENEIGGDKMREIEEKSYNTAVELQTIEQLEELKRLNKRMLDLNSITDTAMKYLNSKNESSFITEGNHVEDEEEISMSKEILIDERIKLLEKLDDLDDLDDLSNNTVQSKQNSETNVGISMGAFKNTRALEDKTNEITISTKDNYTKSIVSSTSSILPSSLQKDSNIKFVVKKTVDHQKNIVELFDGYGSSDTD